MNFEINSLKTLCEGGLETVVNDDEAEFCVGGFALYSEDLVQARGKVIRHV